MATNKNQHYVPRCYLRPFTLDSANFAINIFNIDRQILIQQAPVKNQCSGDYFYGKNALLETAIQAQEANYAAVLRAILSPSYCLEDPHRKSLLRFWLFQYSRTEAAAKRSVEMSESMKEVIDDGIRSQFKLSIKDAVQNSMKTFVEKIDAVDDLKVCLLRNRTATPFVTSDDPAILTNRWYFEDERTKHLSFGLRHSGSLVLLPLSPNILCVGYDGDVYSIPHNSGWADVRNDADVNALNQHQLMNCRANIFIRNPTHGQLIQDEFSKIKALRPAIRHVTNYAVRDRDEGSSTRYRVVDPSEAKDHDDVLVHGQTIRARPDRWPKQILWRTKGAVFTNGSRIGYVRWQHAVTCTGQPFRKEPAR